MLEQLSIVEGDDAAELSADQLVRRAKGEYVVLANLEVRILNHIYIYARIVLIQAGSDCSGQCAGSAL